MSIKHIILLPFVVLFASANAKSLRRLATENEGGVVTIDREIVADTGLPPAGRTIQQDSTHSLPFPPMAPEGAVDVHGDDRKLAVACSSCWWDSFYGYIAVCCDHTGACVYVYC